ncbi:esterase-like activity of phytase family protein [Roseofilum sp. Belize Diploria]|uniref:esterase-like activity of phytase family protein n=2 Tax=unclassified Roseofilum TaxID=2620099 RepID=UPI00298E64BA|nr:esterase-like activity of phytase family protein [Roseofilum sp. Belize Diploria]
MSFARMKRFLVPLFVFGFCLLGLLTGCSLPQVSAQDRLFLPLSLEWVGEVTLPKQEFQETTVGGLSAIAYDRQRDRLYALSDDRSFHGPARFYTLNLSLDPFEIDVETVTALKTPEGTPYAEGSLDPEGLALTPNRTLLIASEGVANQQIPPAIAEYDRQTGQWLNQLPIPQRYIPDTSGKEEQKGVQNNLGFESLTTNPIGLVPTTGEPLRVFVATEAALIQDRDPEVKELVKTRTRWMHYLLSEGPPLLVSEHFYELDTPEPDILSQGLTEILALDEPGHFLTLERSFNGSVVTAKLFQAVTGSASDISNVSSLQGNLGELKPIRKQLVLDLAQLGITLDNLEGMTFGPHFADGSPSLILVSDDNFNAYQKTQFLLFRLLTMDSSREG